MISKAYTERFSKWANGIISAAPRCQINRSQHCIPSIADESCRACFEKYVAAKKGGQDE